MKVGFISCFDEYHNWEAFEEFGFMTSTSLLDFDILVWDIGFLHFGYSFSYEVHGRKGFRELLQDRRRRLHELEIFLSSGKTLIILLTDINNLKQKFSSNSDKLSNLLKEEGLSTERFDLFSFLPAGLERIIRANVVEGRGKRIDFRGDEAFFPAWKEIYKAAWYDTYFTKTIGTPFLFINGTQLPVGTWIPYLNGNTFFIPSHEYDSSDDYPYFFEAALQLGAGLNNFTGNFINIPWQEMQTGSFKDTTTEPVETFAATNSTPSSKKLRQDLRRKLERIFNSSELRNLCFDLDIKYEEILIPAGRYSDAVRELVLYCERKKMLDKLIALCQKERPNEDWSEYI